MPGYRVNHQRDLTDEFNASGYTQSNTPNHATDILYTDNSHTIATRQLVERVVPMDGEMTFDGNVTDILDSLRILLGGTTVRMHVSWSVAE